MEILIPFLLILVFGGFFLYNPVRRKYSTIIGVGGSYLVSIGIILTITLIGAIFSSSIRETLDGGVVALIIYIVLALATIAYLAIVMFVRCETVMQRIMLPFAILIIAFGFATRLMGSIFLHLPMESGKEEPEAAAFPQFIYDADNNPWELVNSGVDNANYYCQKTGETKNLHITDLEYQASSEFHQR